jgi:hypothetical protein
VLLPEGYENIAFIGDGLSVGPSALEEAGQGLFALRVFEAGDIITAFSGVLRSNNPALPVGSAEASHFCTLGYGAVVIDGKSLTGREDASARVGGASFANSKHPALANSEIDRCESEQYVLGSRDITDFRSMTQAFLRATKRIEPPAEIFAHYRYA